MRLLARAIARLKSWLNRLEDDAIRETSRSNHPTEYGGTKL
jgi:hypothetical protein